MSAIYFDHDDEKYLNWTKKNQNGFVLNIGKDNNPKYRVLHSANCYSITRRAKTYGEGSFTALGYRKVCANEFEHIINWIKENGGATSLTVHRPCRGRVPKDIQSEIPAINDFPNELPFHKTIFEGAKKTVLVNKYERDPAARNKCIAIKGVRCSVCNFDFEERYGSRGKNFIHVHHLKPLSQIGEKYQLVPEKDLCPVCPNCHAMIHRYEPLKSIEEIKDILKKQRKGT